MNNLQIGKDHFIVSGDRCFFSLQGEGKTMGYPVVFLRLKYCNLRCVWCDSILKGTLIRTSDKKWIPIEQIQEGTSIIGVDYLKNHFVSRYSYIKSTTTHLVNHKEKEAIKIILENNQEIICTKNHQIFVKRNDYKTTKLTTWKWLESGKLTSNYSVWVLSKPLVNKETKDFILGWLYGYTKGDGGFSDGTKKRRRWESVTYEIIDRLTEYLTKLNITFHRRSKHSKSTKNLIHQVDSIYNIVEKNNIEWKRGFISGFFDAEGYNNDVQPLFANQDKFLLEECQRYLLEFGFSSKIKPAHNCLKLVVSCSLSNRIYFDSLFNYAKNHNEKWLWNKEGLRNGKSKRQFKWAKEVVKIKSVKIIKGNFEFYDIGSTSGNFFANGILVHNTPYAVYSDREDFKKEGEEWSLVFTVEMIKQCWKCKDLNVQKRLVITGGEPLLQREALDGLIDLLPDWKFEIETNGTLMPTDKMLKTFQFNCSPKLENSGNSKALRYNSQVIKALNEVDTQFKFVVSKPEDLAEIENDFIKGIGIDVKKVVLMPLGTNTEDLLTHMKLVAEVAKEKGYRMLSRLQVEIWGLTRRT